ncbi:hypothetical protein PACTADRAFT_51284 [Pachysolen tannophilus NRRL Y-2460]|uniref:Uncharacterized protein n=1 Tax=Pachysolen tannophilus NRRL Y-2460 TaxID=669874 RepID=A0A1E4TRT1_PACTA|nr:hypothetical protein PACTADRAFT_51284 [Pachysolen tannophilus NRRL Y-2460]
MSYETNFCLTAITVSGKGEKFFLYYKNYLVIKIITYRTKEKNKTSYISKDYDLESSYKF